MIVWFGSKLIANTNCFSVIGPIKSIEKKETINIIRVK
ncbi:unnamed protein product, partial [Adineta steineri]